MTFDELTGWFKSAGIELARETDSDEHSRARFFPTTGGILKTMAQDNPKYTYMAIDGVENCMAALKDIEKARYITALSRCPPAPAAASAVR